MKMPLIFERHFFYHFMNVEDIRNYALSLPDVTESFPFGESVLVFKTKGKMFLLLPLDTPDLQFNVKCDPELAVELREEFPDTVLPGYHMNKKHWNTVMVNGNISKNKLLEMISNSHQLVRK